MADDEKEDIKHVLKMVRTRKILNFALLQESGGKTLILKTNAKKPAKEPELLRKEAKRSGGGAKGCHGTMTINGKKLLLNCFNDDVPGSFTKLAKKQYKDENLRFVFLVGGEEMVDEDDEQAQEDAAAAAGPGGAAEEPAAAEPEVSATVEEAQENLEAAGVEVEEPAAGAGGGAEAGAAAAPEAGGNQIEAARKKLNQVFKGMGPALKTALMTAEDGAKRKIGTLAKTFGKEIQGSDMKKAGAVLQLLQKEMKGLGGAAAGAGAGAADPQAETRRAGRATKLADIESRVDALLAEFA